MTATVYRPRTTTAPDTAKQYTHEVIERLSQPARVDLPDTLRKLWDESTPQHRKDGYPQQTRILAAILDRHVNPFTVVTAMDACEKLSQLHRGECLTVLYGCSNTDTMRDFHRDAEEQNLAEAVLALGGMR